METNKSVLVIVGKNIELLDEIHSRFETMFNDNCIRYTKFEDVCHPSVIYETILKCVKEYNKTGKKLLITTTSVYALTTLNLCLQAYMSGKKRNKKTNKILNKNYWLNIKDVLAINIENGEVCFNIIDKETKLICCDYLDKISEQIADKFDSLLEIYYDEKDKFR